MLIKGKDDTEGVYDKEEDDDSDIDDKKENIYDDNLELNLRRFKIFSFEQDQPSRSKWWIN